MRRETRTTLSPRYAAADSRRPEAAAIARMGFHGRSSHPRPDLDRICRAGGKAAATQDLLSLYASDHSPPAFPARGPPQGLLLSKTHDFLRPLERKATERMPPDMNAPATASEDHDPPSEIGTGRILDVLTTRHSSALGAAVKSECGGGEIEARIASEPASTSAACGGRDFAFWEENQTERKTSKEVAVRVDGNNNHGQKPSVLRSKHSATEQRRRSKINERFQMLRDLIPHTDQKRDKASFLSEVIHYVQILQQKVQKYESELPGWNHNAANGIAWQRNPQPPMDSVAEPLHALKNCLMPYGFVNSGHVNMANMTVMHQNCQAPSRTENTNLDVPSKAIAVTIPVQQELAAGFVQPPQTRLIPGHEKTAYPLQTHCLRSDMGSSQILDQDLTADESTINISRAYSQGVRNTLVQSLQNSGVVLSQANISVRISLAKRAVGKSATLSLEHDSPCGNQSTGCSLSGGSEGESGNGIKRQKLVSQ